MKNLFSTLTLAAVFVAFLPQANAGEAQVVWQNPDKYRDVDAGDGHRTKFKERTFSQLEQHFNKLAEQLPQGYMLKIEVSDLDLAGDVNQGGINRLRIVKDIFYPRIDFSYQLLSADKVVVSENEIKLKDMNFLMRNSSRYNSSSLAHEKKMLDSWFKDTFTEFL
ncbi:DUF3016 domain-containing protein [Thalassotalea piscium]|uniref:DUF3016 domain-containing protein n=1 Tax=Thalassotalea piscium TaxID=1230533 RepID=A0A7X0NKR7_9GAMM|nr:DUF3016 domain-containing protein [Thalassotalea piscium]MBB6545186.1 hypothetical protein [Thalassotalea piscium]